jgi:hypothetical protein
MKKRRVIQVRPAKVYKEKRLILRLNNEEILNAMLRFPPKNFKNSFGQQLSVGRA